MKSISVRLKIVSILTILAFIILGYFGISGMRESSHSIDNLYSQGMQHSIRSGKILNSLGVARSSLLLAFQHDPSSPLAKMHDHPLSKHIDDVKHALSVLHSIVDNELLSSKLSSSERSMVNTLASNLDDITKQGFEPAIEALQKEDYLDANKLLLQKINPIFVQIENEANLFLDDQVKEGKATFIESQQTSQRFDWIFGITTAISLVIIMTISARVSRRVINASHILENTATAIANGDLTQHIKITSTDEFSHIAQNVNRITEKFRHVVDTNRISIEQIASSAEESSAVAIQTQKNVSEQQGQTQQIAAAIHEFNATVHEVAQSAAAAAEASDNADKAAERGQGVVQDSMMMIESLSAEMQEAVKAMHQLAAHSEEIGGVVDVIQGISEQTNLLALNAAIEAARAGEFGRGFAVVADEVRTLASRTQNSTQEILQMVQRLQDGSRTTTDKLEKGAENARATVEKARVAAEALVEIARSVDLINSMNTQIATAAEEQTSVTEEINQNITAISDISNETAAGAEQSTRATEELASLSETLRNEISAYKLA
ncbi:methyl-accepting chemotaxis protein [Vibrio sp.]|nr:methyl-accepting chemotaxis protein [Vibrio sp.]